jgi:hypothetical protein
MKLDKPVYNVEINGLVFDTETSSLINDGLAEIKLYDCRTDELVCSFMSDGFEVKIKADELKSMLPKLQKIRFYDWGEFKMIHMDKRKVRDLWREFGGVDYVDIEEFMEEHHISKKHKKYLLEVE